MLDSLLKKWKLFVLLAVVVDACLVVGLLYLFSAQEAHRVAAAESLPPVAVAPVLPAATATPWPGPGQRVTPTPTLPPTPQPTEVLSNSGFPPGFTPTPRPTRAPALLTLPRVLPVFRGNLDVPEINQIYYPEPFFPPGTNNACGPVALYAALQALGSNVEYAYLRDVAVSYGFTDYGISKSGIVGTAAWLNQATGNTLTIAHGGRYNTQALIKEIRTGGVPIVLIYVRKEGGQFKVTPPGTGFGHFLIVDSINMRTKTVQFAGSTLGMDKVPLADFIRSWSGSPQVVSGASALAWQSYLKDEPANNWALVIRRASRSK